MLSWVGARSRAGAAEDINAVPWVARPHLLFTFRMDAVEGIDRWLGDSIVCGRYEWGRELWPCLLLD